ncbi:LCP family protein [Verrucosispora sp. WMMD1129]|uniref:LCP family protein n=1 Tax=Verrucosispora sp. WMMD1129 TaxID=3016093 RepID=UPI00249AD229|nr:LCP family protein [Verrucosispora sp. WMMD1129]WFE44677.1 LCP family protein [Verrucosispora sp. WMMD1129]
MSSGEQAGTISPEQTLPTGDTDGSEKTGRSAGKPRRRWLRITLIVLLVLSLLGVGAVVASGFYLKSVESDIERVDAFDDVPEETRPEVVAKDALNILILGSDSRDPESTGGSRADTIILAHVPRDRSTAQLISIPRDTWVAVPRSKEGRGGRDAKINAAYAWGGLPLMVQTVEQYTKVRIDHVMLVDFAGFKEIIDALGGINVTSETRFTSIHPPFRTFDQGRQRLDGAAALDFSRQRKQFADGDFTRIKHQQQVIKAILDEAASGGILANPARLNSFVRATSSAVSVDREMSLVDMAMELRSLRGNDLTFLTNPTKGTGRVGSESVVFADPEKATQFYEAVRRDAVDEILRSGKSS